MIMVIYKQASKDRNHKFFIKEKQQGNLYLKINANKKLQLEQMQDQKQVGIWPQVQLT